MNELVKNYHSDGTKGRFKEFRWTFNDWLGFGERRYSSYSVLEVVFLFYHY